MAKLAGFLSACLFSAVIAIAPACANDPYYKGKRVTLLVNFGAGSATDIDARLFAKYFSRHLAGEPSLVVQNMEGAGGLTGAQHLGELAPKDGTTIGFLTAIAWNFASRPESFRIDFRKYEFLGYSGGTAVYYVRSDAPPGMKEPADILKAKSLVSGGVAAHSGRDISIRLTLDILGVPFRHVTGYTSGGRARLALQGNEIQLYSDTMSGYKGAVEPTLVKNGNVIPLYFDPLWDGKNFEVDPAAKDLPILPFQEFYKSLNGGKLPSGILWESYLALSMLNGTMQRIIALPPGAPPAAVAAIRAALKKMNSDAEYAAEAIKTYGYAPSFYAEQDTDSKVRTALSVSQEVRKFIADYVHGSTGAAEKK